MKKLTDLIDQAIKHSKIIYHEYERDRIENIKQYSGLYIIDSLNLMYDQIRDQLLLMEQQIKDLKNDK